MVEKCVFQPSSSAKPMLVAVKRLRPALTHNKHDIKDMMQEVALLRKLSHRCVCMGCSGISRGVARALLSPCVVAACARLTVLRPPVLWCAQAHCAVRGVRPLGVPRGRVGTRER